MKINYSKITSRQNQLIKTVVSLRDKKNRDSLSLFFTEGTTLFIEAVRAGNIPQKIFILDTKTEYFNQIFSSLPELKDAELDVYSLTESVFEKISTEKGCEGIISLHCFLDETEKIQSILSSKNKDHRFIILENIQNPGNVGTILRTAKALSIDAVLLCKSADVYSPKTTRASMGAVFIQPFLVFDDIESCISFAKQKCEKIYASALSSDAKNVNEVSFRNGCALIIGNEGNGLSEKALSLADEKLIIPISEMESLNAAIAASIFMWEMKR